MNDNQQPKRKSVYNELTDDLTNLFPTTVVEKEIPVSKQQFVQKDTSKFVLSHGNEDDKFKRKGKSNDHSGLDQSKDISIQNIKIDNGSEPKIVLNNFKAIPNNIVEPIENDSDQDYNLYNPGRQDQDEHEDDEELEDDDDQEDQVAGIDMLLLELKKTSNFNKYHNGLVFYIGLHNTDLLPQDTLLQLFFNSYRLENQFDFFIQELQQQLSCSFEESLIHIVKVMYDWITGGMMLTIQQNPTQKLYYDSIIQLISRYSDKT